MLNYCWLQNGIFNCAMGYFSSKEQPMLCSLFNRTERLPDDYAVVELTDALTQSVHTKMMS